MQYNEFLNKVKTHANMKSDEQAQQVSRAALETLSERIAGLEPKDLAAQLPEELQNSMKTQGKGEQFGVDEFYERVARRANISDSQIARQQTKAVLTTVAEAVTGGEMDHIRDQLPKDYHPLFSTSQ